MNRLEHLFVVSSKTSPALLSIFTATQRLQRRRAVPFSSPPEKRDLFISQDNANLTPHDEQAIKEPAIARVIREATPLPSPGLPHRSCQQWSWAEYGCSRRCGLRASNLNHIKNRAHQPVAFRNKVVCCAHTHHKDDRGARGHQQELLVQLILGSESMVNVGLSVLNEYGREV